MDYKAKLPAELMLEMKITKDQFEELEAESLLAFINWAQVFTELQIPIDQPYEMEAAWRPKNNPKNQFFAVRYSMMVDPVDSGARLEVVGFKPMGKSDYIDYCIKEFGSAPDLVDYTMN